MTTFRTLTRKLVPLAAVPALAAVLLVPSPAAAGYVDFEKDCFGTAVIRCFGYQYTVGDNGSRDLKPYASVEDATGGTNYDVRVKDIQLLRRVVGSSTYTVVSGADDYDGWWTVADSGGLLAGRVHPWVSGKYMEYAVRATISWDTSSTAPVHRTYTRDVVRFDRR